MDNMTFTFRNADEAARCDLTRLGNVTAASGDRLTVKIEDVDLAEWRNDGDPEGDDTLAAIRAAMAACGVWAEASGD